MQADLTTGRNLRIFALRWCKALSQNITYNVVSYPSGGEFAKHSSMLLIKRALSVRLVGSIYLI